MIYCLLGKKFRANITSCVRWCLDARCYTYLMLIYSGNSDHVVHVSNRLECSYDQTYLLPNLSNEQTNLLCYSTSVYPILITISIADLPATSDHNEKKALSYRRIRTCRLANLSSWTSSSHSSEWAKMCTGTRANVRRNAQECLHTYVEVWAKDTFLTVHSPP